MTAQQTFDAASIRYRKAYESARRAANAAETDAQYQAALDRLHRANEAYDAARLKFHAARSANASFGFGLIR